jgi:hypothetical protein
MNKEIQMRKAQEELQNMINFGIHRELAKLNMAIYVAHIEAGFSEEQALKLVIATIKSSNQSEK